MGTCSSSQDVVSPFPGVERPLSVAKIPIYKWTQGPLEEPHEGLIEISGIQIEFYRPTIKMKKPKINYNDEEPNIPGQVN
jgi:hypothetical protein